MALVIETDLHPAARLEYNFVGALAAAVLVGGALAAAGHRSATALVVVIAVVQLVLALAWLFGVGLPGRRGGLLLAAAAAAGADVAVCVWPHSRLGTLLAVFGLAIPAMFIHQLLRGAARTRVVASLAGIAVLIFAEVSLAALVELRHEFDAHGIGGQVVAGAVSAAAAALIVGYLVDLLMSAPRFDPEVPRGLLAVAASAGVGCSVGYLIIRPESAQDFVDGRGAFIGAAIGALAALVAVAMAFVEYCLPKPTSAMARRMRPVFSAVVPLCLLAPVAFMLCIAVRA